MKAKFQVKTGAPTPTLPDGSVEYSTPDADHDLFMINIHHGGTRRSTIDPTKYVTRKQIDERLIINREPVQNLLPTHGCGVNAWYVHRTDNTEAGELDPNMIVDDNWLVAYQTISKTIKAGLSYNQKTSISEGGVRNIGPLANSLVLAIRAMHSEYSPRYQHGALIWEFERSADPNLEEQPEYKTAAYMVTVGNSINTRYGFWCKVDMDAQVWSKSINGEFGIHPYYEDVTPRTKIITPAMGWTYVEYSSVYPGGLMWPVLPRIQVGCKMQFAFPTCSNGGIQPLTHNGHPR